METQQKREVVKATNETIHEIVKQAIAELGNEADLNFIDVSEVTNMSHLFEMEETKSFNGDISRWDVGQVADMGRMFAYSQFNGDISRWDVNNVTIHDDFAFYSKLEKCHQPHFKD